MSVVLKLPSNIVRIERGEKILFFNPDIPSWLVTNSNGALLLSLCDGRNSISDILESLREAEGDESYAQGRAFFSKALSSRLFEEGGAGEIPIAEERQHLSNVQFSISASCNLACTYCYATDREESSFPPLTLSDYQRLADEIVGHFGSGVSFTLTGGEPLLNKDVFKIGRYLRDLGCSVDILTNGTLINPSNISDLKSSFDSVSISIDGSSASRHDTFRGNGSYAKVESAIALLDSHGIPYRLSMTVNRKNIDDVEAMAKLYGNRMNFAPLFPAGRASSGREDVSISGKEYFECLKCASGVNPLGYCESTLESSQERRRCKCAIGGYEISVSPTGDVYPCQLLHYPEFLIGNVHNGSLVELLSGSPVIERCSRMVVDNIEGCSSCFLRYVCGGACRARAYHESKNIFTSGSFCEYEREAFIDGIFSLYSENII